MTIKLHDLRPAPGSKTEKTRVGRGEGSKGKTAGRGTKGTKARKNVPATLRGWPDADPHAAAEAQGLHATGSAPSTRSSTSATSPRRSPRAAPSVSTSWSPRALVRKNVLVKVLGDGKLTVKVDVTAHKFSGSAREAITAAGGTATEL